MNNTKNALRLNIGFIIHETVGFTREFEIDLPHFELSEDFSVADLKGSIRFDRTQRGILLTSTLSGAIITNCVRCLDPFSQKLMTNFTELYAFSQRDMTDSELLVPDSGLLDLTPMVREYLLLDIPIKPLCKRGCKGLCPHCGSNLNTDQCDCIDESIDPRLAKLKDLLNNTNSE